MGRTDSEGTGAQAGLAARIAAASLAGLLLLTWVAGASDYRYEPATQVTTTASGFDGSLAKQLEPGRSTGGPDFHLIVREYAPNQQSNRNYGRGVYYSYDGSSWSRHVFTPDPEPDGSYNEDRHSTDFRFVVRANDEIHVVHEAKYYADTLVWVGYKNSGDSALWAPETYPYMIQKGSSPRLALYEGVSTDSLHVIFAGNNPNDNGASWTTHATKGVADSSWKVTYVTNKFLTHDAAGSITVDDNGLVHIVSDRDTTLASGAKPDTVYHVAGFPPTTAGGNWTLTSGPTVIDAFTAGAGSQGLTGTGEVPQSASTRIGDQLHYVWEHLNTADSNGFQDKVIAFRTLDTDGSTNPANWTWMPDLSSPPEILSQQDDGIRSGQPFLTVDGSAIHVFWQERVGGRLRLMHRYNPDLAGSSAWGPIMEVYPEFGDGMERATAVVMSGTAYVVGTSDGEGWLRTGSAFSGFTFAAGETTAASAGVYFLEGDLEVPSTSTLLLPQGTTLSFARADDYENEPGVGSDTTRAELKILGQLISDGDASAPVILSSPGHVAGSWGGAIFDLSGCEHTTYGYFGTFEPVSDLHDTYIEFGEKGISLENFGAPRLADVTFFEIAGDRHIYLDSTDVFLPYGYFESGTCSGDVEPDPATWDLLAGTEVVAANAVADTSQDAVFWGEDGKVDLIPYAKLTVIGTESDSAWFRPEVAHPDTCRDWGGLTLTEYAAGSRLSHASIGYAANPVFMFYPDSATALDSCRVHHFAETGIWVAGSGGDVGGAYIQGTTVERGSGIDAAFGDLGIYLDQADNVKVLGSTVDLRNLNASGGGTGILAAFSKSFCESSPPNPRLLRIGGCLIVGPTTGGDDYIGFGSNWLCGLDDDRDVELIENGIYGWQGVGMDFYQTADVQVSCNHILGCRRGVDIYRDSEPTGTSLRFKNNKIEALTSLATLFAFRTNDSEKAKLGPSNSLRGDNRLEVNQNLTKFIYEEDGDAANVLNARQNYWIAAGLLSDSTQIKSRIVSSDSTYEITGFRIAYSDSFECDANVPAPPGGGGSSRRAPRGGPADIPRPGAVRSESVRVLGPGYPNPAAGTVCLNLVVPIEWLGVYSLEVFEVSGRRVYAAKQDISAPGRYEVIWNARDGSGIGVASGVYFLKLRGPGGFDETRKVTLLR